MLTELSIRKATPQAKPYRLADQSGLYLEVRPNGSKLWRLKYRHAGKENRLALGAHPETTLRAARDAMGDARRKLGQKVDPAAERRAQRQAVRTQATQAPPAESFEAVAREWFAKKASGWAASHACKVLLRLENDVLPWLGARPVSEITAPEILAVLKRVEARGAVDSAHRELQYIGRICRYGVVTGRLTRDPSADLKGEALAPVPTDKHFASLTDPEAIGGLLRAIHGYQGSFVVRSALRLAPLTVVRPGELRKAEWSEVNLVRAEWRIGAARMKMRREHMVPLSRQAVEVLTELKAATGGGRFVFPSARGPDRSLSDNGVLAALRTLGYPVGTMTGHGFRSMASTLLNEAGWNGDVIERQLAHVHGDTVRRAYNHAQYLPERRRMLQAWADYLDALRDGREASLAPSP